ncbi:MAG TPA: serine hydrolase [Stellaceae bacterium]|nr:serine hydrolase [Stellaceae bacterium]
MASDATPANGRFPAITGIVEHEIAARHIPGAVILIAERGRIVYRRAFGLRTILPAAQALVPDTVFDLASLTKVIATTTAVMQLVEEKRLRLADPVAKYWPAFGANGKRAITIEQLLTHTSGLRPDLVRSGGWSGERGALQRIAADRPIHPPGSRFLYSDLNFIVLGALVERISGERLDRYCARHIFAPLGMHETGFNPRPAEAPRIAPTELASDGANRDRVQDPTALRMGGVAGHAGLFSTADDLAKFAEMLLGGGVRDGVRILSAASVARMTAPHVLPGGIERGLGWDVASPYANGMDLAFGPGSYGHTGYTGTSLWIDPARKAFLVILTSRLYPDDRGDAKPLRREIAAVVASAKRASAVRTGIDVLAREAFAPLAGLRVGLLTNQTGRDASGRRTIDVLAHAGDVHLEAIFSPEHGIGGDHEGRIASGTDAATGLPIYSLYGSTRRPTAAMLAGIDALVVDLQDAGVRFFTYATTLAYAMEEAAHRHVKVFVLDRPNPIGAAGVRGPVLDAALRSFTGYFPMPVEHGMTIGELATMFNAENHIGADLTVVPMQGYRHRSWYDETGLPWIDPSPNLRSLAEAILYPGVALVEGTNVSVGRGTGRPFELVGAPWIDGSALASYLSHRGIAGVSFAPVAFTPDGDRYAGRLCHGVRIGIRDRSTLNAPRLGLEIAAALHRLYPSEFAIRPLVGLVGSRAAVAELKDGAEPSALAATWQSRLHAFEAIRDRYLLYP